MKNGITKDALIVLLTATMFFAGCAGQYGNPIAAYKAGDERRSCTSLHTEIAQLDKEIATLLPKSDKSGYNTVMLVTGLFVIIPLFFMDFKNGEKVELQACRQRRNSLELLAAQKGCVLSDMTEDIVIANPNGREITGYQTAGNDENGKPILVPVYK